MSPKTSEVSAVGTGPEWVLRAKEPEELRGVTKREFGEHEPETVCATGTSSRSA